MASGKGRSGASHGEEWRHRASDGRAHEAARQSQRAGLEEIGGEETAPRRAQALEDGEGGAAAAQERLHAHAHADAAHEQRDEAGEAEIHGELIPEAAQPRLSLAVGADAKAGIVEPRDECRPDRLRVGAVGKPDQRAVAHAAARPHETGGLEVGGGDEHARSQGEDADRAIGLTLHEAGDAKGDLADAQGVAHREAEPGEQRRLDQRAALPDERLQRRGRRRHQATVERIAGLNRLDLDELHARRRGGMKGHLTVGGGGHLSLRHRRELEDARRAGAGAREPVHCRGRAWPERLRRANLEVRAHEGLAGFRHGLLETASQSADGDQRGHAEGDAGHEVAEVPARAAQLAGGLPDGPVRHAGRGSPRPPPPARHGA